MYIRRYGVDVPKRLTCFPMILHISVDQPAFGRIRERGLYTRQNVDFQMSVPRQKKSAVLLWQFIDPTHDRMEIQIPDCEAEGRVGVVVVCCFDPDGAADMQ